MKRIIIANLVDWSESFVDENGTFYCGTTLEQKKNAAKLVREADLVIETTDLHPITAPEHNINGGLYPAHNAVNPEEYSQDFIYCLTQTNALKLGNKTLSPRLTKIIADELNGKERALIVPRGLYYQSGLKEPFCKPEDIEKTFDSRIITAQEFLQRDYKHIIAPKQYFDATRLDSDWLIDERYNEDEAIDRAINRAMTGVDPDNIRIPKTNYNVYSLLEKKFPRSEYEIVMINTGVVEGICRLHTSIGQRQMFPTSRIINVSDATTHLYGIGLGYETQEQSREACTRVGKDIGIEYLTTEQALEEIRRIR